MIYSNSYTTSPLKEHMRNTKFQVYVRICFKERTGAVQTCKSSCLTFPRNNNEFKSQIFTLLGIFSRHLQTNNQKSNMSSIIIIIIFLMIFIFLVIFRWLHNLQNHHEHHCTSDQSDCYCAVCLSQVTGGDKIRSLPVCNHRFHSDCIALWLKNHSTCPLCRYIINKNDRNLFFNHKDLGKRFRDFMVHLFELCVYIL